MRLLQSKVTLLLLALITVASITQLSREAMRRHAINAQIRKIEQDMSNLKNKRFELNRIISYLQSDAYIEEEARKKLNLRRPGEAVYVVPDVKQRADDVGNQAGSMTAAQEWIHYFFSTTS